MNHVGVIKRLDTPVRPFPSSPLALGYHQREAWPASWIASDDCVRGANSVTAYRLRFCCERTAALRVFVTADQRYWLYLDGRRIGMGSERGCMRKWFYETYDISLSEGPHTLAAITWHLPENPPWAQASAQPGFLMAAEAPFTDQLSTGLAPWESRVLKDVAFLEPTQQIGQNIGCGARIRFEGGCWADVLACDQAPWSGVHPLLPGNNAFWQGASPRTWVLHPAHLPAMRLEKRGGAAVVLVSPAADAAEPLKLDNTIRSEAEQWQAMLAGRSAGLHVPPHTSRRVLIDLRDYVCAYYALTTEGGEGSEISVAWAERLSAKPGAPIAPSERHTVEGLFFVGTADQFCPRKAGRRACHEPLWWQAGRWVQITVKTADARLMIHGFDLLETGYPLADESRFQSDDETLNAVAPVCYRTLQACAHETYMDCPYWEQLQYVGDTRIQALADDLAHQSFSEHTQALALLTDRLSAAIQESVQHALVSDTRLLRAGPYFSHYVCLALSRAGAGNALHARLVLWRRFLDAGFHTFPEGGIAGRSDCHAWSAHPLFHMASSILGIRPATCGFDTVLIAPVLGPLRNVAGTMPHPKGDISVTITVSEGHGVADVTLPAGLSGSFRWGTRTLDLHEGSQMIECDDGVA